MSNINVGSSTQARGEHVRGPEGTQAPDTTAKTTSSPGPQGTAPADSVDRSGKSQATLGEGAAAQTGTAEQLGALHAAAGTPVAGATVAALGDVDIHVVANAELQDGGLMASAHKLAKDGNLAGLAGVSGALRSEQKRHAGGLFGGLYADVRQTVSNVV